MKKSYLITSDLHLTEVREPGRNYWQVFKSKKYTIDRAFSKMLDFYIQKSKYPLKLIVNGDFIDFRLVSTVPRNPCFQISKREKKYGLDPTEEKSRWKLRLIIKDHKYFFKSLAEFINRGNEFLIVIGNHDIEFYWESMKETLSEAMYLLIKHREKSSYKEFYKNIHVVPWFYYEKDLFYIEHGSQYDAFCWEANPLYPVKDIGSDEIEYSFGDITIKHMVNRLGHFSPFFDLKESRGLKKYLTIWLRYSFRLPFSYFKGSLEVVARILKKRLKHRLRRIQLSMLNDISTITGLEFEKVKKIQNLGDENALLGKYSFIRKISFDIFVILVSLIILVTIIFFGTELSIILKLITSSLLFVMLYFLSRHLSKRDTEDSQQREHVYTDSATEIARILDVPYVFLAHTHEPFFQHLDNGSIYINTGTWAPIIPDFKKGKKWDFGNTYVYLYSDKNGYKHEFNQWLDNRPVPVKCTTQGYMPGYKERFLSEKE